MEMILIKPDSAEWNFMWNWVASHPLNAGLEEPTVAEHEGEVWQYMGSFRQDTRTIHTFRHRDHPITNDVVNLSHNGSDSLSDDDIEKKIGVK